MMEQWKDIEGYEGVYMISDRGRVYSHRSKRNISHRNMKGYRQVCLQVDNVREDPLVHRLVAQAFVPNPGNLPQVNHKNGNKSDNRPENLEWVTNRENVMHAVDVLGKMHGERKAAAKLKAADIVDIRTLIGYGVNNVEIGRLYGVDARSISSIKHGVTWKRVA